MENITSRDILNTLIVSITFGFGFGFPASLFVDNIWIAIGIGMVAGGMLFVYMLFQTRKQHAENPAEVNENARRYMLRFGLAMIGYIVLLLTSIYLQERVEGQALSIAIAILPVLPVLLGIWAYMDWLRNLDEFQRQIQLEAIGFSMAMTGVVTFTIGFLETAGVQQPGYLWVFPMMIIFWGVGQFIAQRRYA
ncbi:MAG: hypothetical protein AAFR81_26320 [Chloroflexota bacterium]